MTADRPARPPPITIIFGFIAIFILLLCARAHFHCPRPRRISRLLRMRAEGRQAAQSRADQHEKERKAHDQKPLAGLFSRDNSPFRAKQPDAVSKMPRGGQQTSDKKQEKR